MRQTAKHPRIRAHWAIYVRFLLRIAYVLATLGILNLTLNRLAHDHYTFANEFYDVSLQDSGYDSSTWIDSVFGLDWMGLIFYEVTKDSLEAGDQDVEYNNSVQVDLAIDNFTRDSSGVVAVDVEVSRITLVSGQDWDVREPLCLVGIYVWGTFKPLTNGAAGGPVTYVEEPQLAFRDFCTSDYETIYDLDTDARVIPDEYPIRLENEDHWYPVYRNYPFDQRIVEMAVLAEIVTSNGQHLLIAPQVSYEIATDDWVSVGRFINMELSVGADMEPRSTESTALWIEFTRSPSRPLLAFLLLSVLFLFIFLLLFVPEIGSAMEAAIAILLALWGVKEILVPPSIDGWTLVDTATMFLYVWLACVGVARFVVVPVSNWLNRRGYDYNRKAHSIERKSVRADPEGFVQKKDNLVAESASEAVHIVPSRTVDHSATDSAWIICPIVLLLLSIIFLRRRR